MTVGLIVFGYNDVIFNNCTENREHVLILFCNFKSHKLHVYGCHFRHVNGKKVVETMKYHLPLAGLPVGGFLHSHVGHGLAFSFKGQSDLQRI